MSYRTLDADKIVDTLERLHARIQERFPQAGLAKVCAGLVDVARDTKQRAQRIEEPNTLIRLGGFAVIAAGLAAVAYVASIIEFKRSADDLFGVMQGIEAAINVLVLSGAAIFFLSTLESRWKRQRALAHLHELRTIVHVIDMHQLTKDPASVSQPDRATRSSPKRVMTAFELLRYLDYCSEMLSLCAKLATLYAQSSRDAVVISSVTELEQISANLSHKIWQKITLIRDVDGNGAVVAAAKAQQPEPVSADRGGMQPAPSSRIDAAAD